MTAEEKKSIFEHLPNILKGVKDDGDMSFIKG